MKKPKKITVKLFLNKTPRGNTYPWYTQVTYNRRNTQIKCYDAYSLLVQNKTNTNKEIIDLI